MMQRSSSTLGHQSSSDPNRHPCNARWKASYNDVEQQSFLSFYDAFSSRRKQVSLIWATFQNLLANETHDVNIV